MPLVIFQRRDTDKSDSAMVNKYLTFKSRISKPKGQKFELINGYTPFDVRSLKIAYPGQYIKDRLNSITKGDKTNRFEDEEFRLPTIEEYIRLGMMLRKDNYMLNKKKEKFLTIK